MKKFLSKSLILMGAMIAAVTGFTSCGGDDDDTPTPTLSVSNTSLSMEAGGGSMNLQVTSNTGWYVSSGASWCSVSPQQGTNNGVVYVTASENTSTSSRSCNLTISTTDGSLSQTVQITQAGLQASLKSIDPVSLGSEKGASNTFSIETNVAWTLSGKPEWLTVTPLNGNGNATVTVTTLSANETAEERTATLTVTAGGQTTTVKVTQASMYANCSATVANELILSNGYYADLKFSSNVLGYVEKYFHASYEKIYTSQQLYDLTLEGTSYSAEDYDFTYNPSTLEEETSYIYCVIPYISDEGGIRRNGPMKIVHFTTKSSSITSDAPVSITSYTTSQWRYKITKQSRCHHYYQLHSTGDKAYYIANHYNDAMLAHAIKDCIEKDEDYEYHINDMAYQTERDSEDKYFFVWTWGVNDVNEFSGNIRWAWKDLSSTMNAPQNRVVKKVGRSKMKEIEKGLVIKKITR